MDTPAQNLAVGGTRAFYQPLSPGWTRVVRITNLSDQELPGLQLHHCQLLSNETGDGFSTLVDSQPATYVALSYTWGDDEERVLVPVQLLDADNLAHPITITRSLQTALSYLSEHIVGDTWFLWVDQISIDQSSPQEMASQIKMMKEIYEAARVVVVWLGPAKDDSDVALATLRQMGQSYHDRDKEGASHTGTKNQKSSANDFAQRLIRNVSQPQWDSIVRLLRRSWFDRAWIRQEVTAGEYVHAIVACGESRVPFGFFLTLLSTVYYMEHDMASQIRIDNIDLLSSFGRRRRVSKGEMPLLTLARELRRCEATDPRDKIFCMLNFATDIRGDTSTHFDLDYSESPQQTYTRFAIWSIAHYKDLGIFADCTEFHQQEPNQLGLPTWVPNWTYQRRGAPLFQTELKDDPTSRPLFHTNGQDPNTVSFKGSVGDFSAAKYLALKGIRVAKVTKVLESDTAYYHDLNTSRRDANSTRYCWAKFLQRRWSWTSSAPKRDCQSGADEAPKVVSILMPCQSMSAKISNTPLSSGGCSTPQPA